MKLKQELEAAGISFPTVLPLFKNPPNKAAANAWVEAHYAFPLIKKIAKKMVDNINYISFERFFAGLEQTIQSFNLHIQDRPYILWIGQYNKKDLNDGCSDQWAAGLALEYGKLRWPSAIATTKTLIECLRQNQTIKDVLLLDDASYSAGHIGQEISHLDNEFLLNLFSHSNAEIREDFQRLENKQPKRNLSIGIPFMTTHAFQSLSKLRNGIFSNVQVLQHETIKMQREILSLDEIAYLETFGYILGYKTLTYFDHTYPDLFSTIDNFKSGTHLLLDNVAKAMKTLGYIPGEDHSASQTSGLTVITDPKEWRTLINKLLPSTKPAITPTIIQPYRLLNKKDQLKWALSHDALGERTQHLLPEKLAIKLIEEGIKIEPIDMSDSGMAMPYQPVNLPMALGFFSPMEKPCLPGEISKDDLIDDVAEGAFTLPCVLL